MQQDWSPLAGGRLEVVTYPPARTFSNGNTISH